MLKFSIVGNPIFSPKGGHTFRIKKKKKKKERKKEEFSLWYGMKN